MATRVCAMLGVAMAVVGACSADVAGPRLVGTGDRVLFIGNSLTYVNDVPGILQALARAGGTDLAVETVAGPNMALIDHWTQGIARREIEKGGWRFVIMQQGPTSVEINRDTLRLAATRFAPSIRAAGATPALYSVWPAASRKQDFARSIESYAIAAADVDGLLLPAGSAWLAAWARDPSLPLYGGDQFHPSAAGSYLAALVMYARLLGKDPVGLPARLTLASGATLALDEGMARVLQEVARDVAKPNAAPAR